MQHSQGNIFAPRYDPPAAKKHPQIECFARNLIFVKLFAKIYKNNVFKPSGLKVESLSKKGTDSTTNHNFVEIPFASRHPTSPCSISTPSRSFLDSIKVFIYSFSSGIRW